MVAPATLSDIMLSQGHETRSPFCPRTSGTPAVFAFGSVVLTAESVKLYDSVDLEMTV